MNKQVAIDLIAHAEEVARRFSHTDRAKNVSDESFSIKEIRPLSEHMATVFYLKSSGKLAMAIFYYIAGQSRWEYFFPTDSHLLGLSELTKLKAEVEKFNFKYNS